MDQSSWQKVKDVFLQVVDADRNRRDALIESLCGDDHECSDKVKALFRGDDGHQETLAPWTGSKAEPMKEIGPFRVIREIGRGGMGSVYEVQRKSEEFEQTLALKLMHPSLAGNSVDKRFALERRILAKLEHPNIARFIDGGVSPMGPYYVMEYIVGKPITDYCDRHALTIRQRIELFGQVCDAVQFSHQHFIVHRDIKPGNILVTEDGRVKLLDFGIAKVIHGDDSSALQQTVFQTYTRDDVPMTPVYASPEQYLNEPVTAASDVYSLGLVLYQLLTGRLAYDFENKSLLEIDNLILRQPPTQPSSRSHEKMDHGLTSGEIAEKRQLTPEKLKTTLKGDLDAIILKALRKDPADRYRLAAELADDLKRYLQCLPVSACPPSRAYRIGMFVRRHKTGVAFATVLTLALITGSIGTSMGWQRAIEAREIAEAERVRALAEVEKTTEILDFLQGMLASADPRESGRDVKIVDVLDRSAKDLSEDLADRPEIEAAVRMTLGMTYNALGKFHKAAEQLTEAQDIWEHTGAPHTRTQLEANMHLSAAYHESGQYQKAYDLMLSNLRVLQETFGNEDRLTLENKAKLGMICKSLGRLKEAERLLGEALEVQLQVLGRKHKDTINSMESLGNVVSDQGRFEEARGWYEQVLEITRSMYPEDHPDILEVRINLCTIDAALGDLDRAERKLVELLDKCAQVFGSDHLTTLMTSTILATVLDEQKKFVEAREVYEKQLPLIKNVLGPEHFLTLATANGLAKILFELDEYAEAKQIQLEVLRIVTEKFGQNHSETIKTLCNLGVSHQYLNEIDDAIVCHREATLRSTEALGADHTFTLISRFEWGKDLVIVGDVKRGKAMMTECMARIEAQFGKDHWLHDKVVREFEEVFPGE